MKTSTLDRVKMARECSQHYPATVLGRIGDSTKYQHPATGLITVCHTTLHCPFRIPKCSTLCCLPYLPPPPPILSEFQDAAFGGAWLFSGITLATMVHLVQEKLLDIIRG